MNEAEKIVVGVSGGVLGIAALFGLAMLVVGKGDEPMARPLPVVTEKPKTQVAKVEVPVASLAPQPGASIPEPEERPRPLEPVVAEQQPAPAQTEALVDSAPSPPAAQSESKRESKRSVSGGWDEPAQARSETQTGTTATGIPTYTGPRGGVYHYSKSGRKVYERRRK